MLILVCGQCLSYRLLGCCLFSQSCVDAFYSEFIPVWGQCLLCGEWSARSAWCSSPYRIGSCHPVLGRHHVLGVCPGIWWVPCPLVMSMYQAYRIQYFNPTLFALSISCCSPNLPILACGRLSHCSVLSFLNQNPHLGSICGETAALEGREHIINTLPCLTWHSIPSVWERAVPARGAMEEGKKIWYYPAVRIHEISARASEIRCWER